MTLISEDALSDTNEACPKRMTDQQILIEAIEKAGVVIAEHIEPGHRRDAEGTIEQLELLVQS